MTEVPKRLFHQPTVFETSYLIYGRWDQVPEHPHATNGNWVLHVEWPGFELSIPWPEGLTAEEAIAKWKAE